MAEETNVIQVENGWYEGTADDEEIEVVGKSEEGWTPVGQPEEVKYDAVVYGNQGNDTLHGLDNATNWLNGSEGNDTIYGGIGGESMLSGDIGDDVVYAGKLLSSKNGSDFVDEVELVGEDGEIITKKRYIKLNTVGVEMYGAAGNDILVSGKGDDFIWGGEGDDQIILNGGSNRLVFVEDKFGKDVVDGATSKDRLDFSFNNAEGHKFNNLEFSVDDKNNLIIEDKTVDGDASVTINNFYGSKDSVDTIYAVVGDENKKLSIKEDAFLNIARESDSKSFNGNDYNEVISANKVDEKFNLGKGSDTINFSGYFGNDEVTLNKGETLNLNFDSHVRYEIKGNDVVITTKESSPIRYYVVADVTGVNGENPSLDGHEVPAGMIKDGKITFFMSQSTMIGTEGSDINAGDCVWSTDPIYTIPATDDSAAIDVVVMLSNANFFERSFVFDGMAFSNLRVIKVAGGTPDGYNESEVVEDITAEYKKAIKGAKDYSFNEKMFNSPEYRSQYSSVVLKNFAGKEIDANVLVNGESIYDTDFAKLVSFNVNNNESLAKGKFKGGVLAETINASEFVSKNGVKGVNINSGAGDDMITGSNYNDIIKSNAGNNLVDEFGGTNKITLGKGNDIVELFDFSSNTVKLGNGTNAVGIVSVGTNKVTGGKDADGVLAVSGQNTINTGKGESLVLLQGGENKVTGGKDADVYYIGGGLNTIKSGNGKDKFYVGEAEDIDFSKYVEGADNIDIDDEGSYNIIKAGNGGNVFNLDSDKATNVVTSGKGVDVFNLSAGTNYVSSGAGADTFKVTGGYNFLDGGKGDDIYDFSTVNGGTARVTDTKGANVLNVGNINLNVFFDVEVGKKGKAIYGDLRFVGDNGNGVTSEEFHMDYYSANKKSFAKISSGYTEGQEVTFNVSELASQVASWLTENDYASTDAVFAKNDTDDVAALLAMYTGYSQNSYQVV